MFESLKGLLFYPVQYEGEEMSPNIFYTGATPNQQLIPAAEFMMSQEGGAEEEVLPAGHRLRVSAHGEQDPEGVPALGRRSEKNIIEEYTPFGHADYQTIVGKIKEFGKAGDAAVLSTINGDSNVPFYKEFANQGLTARQVPIMAFSVAEDELRSMETEHLVGHLAAWNYYQSIDTPENKAFVEAFKTYAEAKGLPGGRNRVTDDPIEAAYFGVYVWKAAVEKASSFDVDKVFARRSRPRVRRAGRQEEDARGEPPHLQAGLHRQDPRGRPVRRDLEVDGPRRTGGLQPLPKGGELRLPETEEKK